MNRTDQPQHLTGKGRRIVAKLDADEWRSAYEIMEGNVALDELAALHIIEKKMDGVRPLYRLGDKYQAYKNRIKA